MSPERLLRRSCAPRSSVGGSIRSAVGAARALEHRTRPVDPETRAAMDRRYRELPPAARTPAQALGRIAVGCEGTHGVFPQCNLSCTPCYHSRDANRVRIDAEHTLAQVRAQLRLLRARRGPRAHAQLIGGEVSLLDPATHAEALSVMRDHGREPMSMTHGDFDYDYLQAVALGPDGAPRTTRLSFAAHFDMLMFGRRGHERPPDEASLHPARRRFVAMFDRLRHEHGVHSYLAHNMTVTPHNLDQIADVVRECRDYGFDLFSFQPAAEVGDDRRWRDDFGDVDSDRVWTAVEAGVGRRLPYRAVQVGDHRCNRATYGYYVGADYFPLLDDADPRDLRTRDAYYRYFGGMNFAERSPGRLTVKLLRVALRHPAAVAEMGRWFVRQARAVGIRRLLRHHGIRPVAYTMHSFMPAADVGPAWAAMQRSETCHDPHLAATQERLAACFYAMAHPETGELIPACVQHSVLDPVENRALRTLLPLTPTATPAPPTRPAAPR